VQALQRSAVAAATRLEDAVLALRRAAVAAALRSAAAALSEKAMSALIVAAARGYALQCMH